MDKERDEDKAARWRIYPSTYVALAAVVAVAGFHLWTTDPNAVHVPMPAAWVEAVEDWTDVAMLVGPRVGTICALGPGQDTGVLPRELAGARAGSPSRVAEGSVRLILLDREGRFLVEADRRRTGRAPTLDVSEPGWCAPVSQLRVEPNPGNNGSGAGAVLVRDGQGT